MIQIRKHVLIAIGLFWILAGCKKDENKGLADKKTHLAELQKQATNLKAEIEKLKNEIEKIEPSKVDKVKTVTVAPIIPSNFQHFVEATGRLEAENNVLVSPQMGGAITNLYVRVGDFVRKGQTVASIDNSIMKSSIQEVQVQLETAKNIFERQKNLWDQKIGTEVQYIQAKSNVESLQKRIATLKSQNSLNNVVAPISGMIDEIRFKPGEMAAPGLGIARIINSARLKVVANIPDTYAGTIAKGDMVTVKFPDLQKEVRATLSFVGQTINPVSRTFSVEARLSGGNSDMKPNLTAILNINDQSHAGAISIPQNLIQNTEQGMIVYVAETNGNKKIARSRIVTTGLSYNGKVEIKSGLSANDVLITEGYQEIVDGQMINY